MNLMRGGIIAVVLFLGLMGYGCLKAGFALFEATDRIIEQRRLENIQLNEMRG